MRRRAEALRDFKRFREARVLESISIAKQVSGFEMGYTKGHAALASIAFNEGDYKCALESILEARLYIKPDDSSSLWEALNLQALILMSMHRYQEALIIREEELALGLRMDGPNHSRYAVSCLNAANLYARLNQMEKGIEYSKQAIRIRTKLFGSSHQSTKVARESLRACQRGLTDPAAKREIVLRSDRMCNVDGCQKVEKNMDFCTSCKTHYVCSGHKEKITEHIVVCSKFPDALPDEKKGQTIVKCRRCRKQTKLMKCSVCESVWYCGAECQKEDWKRHKVFCGKK